MLRCETLTQAVLQDIDSHNGYLTAFSRVFPQRAMAAAASLQQEFDRGLDRGPLHGIPYAIKEIFDVEGHPNPAGTPLLEGNIAKSDAAVIKKLIASGAILVGHTHSSPLAATILGINHAYGTPHNPWKEENYLPGGSSSGSAVAVAAGLVPFALGSDTGGSIRVPAALCGIVGLSPTSGVIDGSGMWPLAPSLDAIGPLAHSVQDAVSIYNALQGQSIDSTTDLQGLRIGICENVFFKGVQPAVRSAILESGQVLETLGAEICTISIPSIDHLYELMCETSFIAIEAYPIHQKIVDHPQSDWVIHWLRKAQDYSQQHVQRARQKYTQIINELVERIQPLDALIVPTTPIVAPPLSTCESLKAHEDMSALLSRNTLIGKLVGWCSLSVPCGKSPTNLPIGLMIYANAGQEKLILRVAQAFETATSFAAQMQTPPFSFINSA
ncbi:MAG: amidase [Acaryochloris sp. CRU_2_0]|nr:amidase [Acaryochloris sp. CRU_2_0]